MFLFIPLMLFIAFPKEGLSLDGVIFPSSRYVGQEVLLPKCDAHFCKVTDNHKRCNCQDTCYQQRDCCLDALSETRVAQLLDSDPWTCIWTLKRHGPYAVIGKCPSTFSNEAGRKACEDEVEPKEDPNRLLPVKSTRSNSTYKNIYCGQCNEGDIQAGQFQLKFRCNLGKNVTSVQAALDSETCDTHVDEKSTSYCVTFEKTVTSCPDSWQHTNATYAKEVRWRCHTYYAPITLNATRFRNAFCALCNNVPLQLEDTTCRNSNYPIDKEFILRIDGEFNSGTLIPGAGGGKVCKAGEVYDPFRKQCRQVLCANESNCDDPYTLWEDEGLPSEKDFISPCNMSLLNSNNFTVDNSTRKLTVKSNTNETFEEGEYEIILTGKHNGSALVCRKSGSSAVPLFPQHFCERRHLLGYGSCGCEPDCVQSRQCCLDALDETAAKTLMARSDAWLCLNDSRHSSALAKCPTNFTDRLLRNQCETVPPITQDPLLHVPVFAWENSAVYRNVFCAACNGITNVTFYDVRFLCVESTQVRNGLEAAEAYMKSPDLCSLRVEANDPELPIKSCVQDPECKQCPPSWGKTGDPRQVAIRWRCEHYYAPVEINDTCYRNDFCAFCNDINPTEPGLHRKYSDHVMKKSEPSAKYLYPLFTAG